MTKPRADDPAQLERLANDLRYEPETGCLYWTRRKRNGTCSYPTGCLNTDGYLRIKFEGRMFSAHRIIWYIFHGEQPPNQIDHIDGNKSNNRINNLRLATPSQNQMNIPPRINNTSGVKGVYFEAKCTYQPWRAAITIDGKIKAIGCFSTKEAAIAARLAAEQELFREFRK